MDEDKRAPAVCSEYRLSLPEKIDPRQLLLALGFGMASDAVDPGPTLTEFAPRFISQYAKANRQKPRGISSKESHLKHHLIPALGHLRLNEIRHEHVQALKAQMGTACGKTVNNVLSTLSMMLKVAVRWEIISSIPRIDPVPTLAPAYRFYDKHEYERLIDGARNTGPRELAALLVGGDCGLRMGEIIALEWRDIDTSRQQIHVQRAESKGDVTAPKGNKDRFVPMTFALSQALKRVPNGSTSRVFHNDQNQTISEQNLRTWLAKSQRAAGLEARGATHVLRHTYCSHLAMAGVPLRTIMELAGHTSERTTMRYMHLAPSEKGRAIKILEQYRTLR